MNQTKVDTSAAEVARASEPSASPEAAGIPDQDPRKAMKTSAHYKTEHLPTRFEYPGIWNYSVKKQHPLYTTTSSRYGHYAPTVHEMPNKFHGQSSKFSELMGARTINSGMNH
ncbi:hypothetical protein HDV05_003557 [Chytridiales sp. JEL 0842]|nr:hypothetical protein HDV05_003557 [Chytridiales sp. JEL 0842]